MTSVHLGSPKLRRAKPARLASYALVVALAAMTGCNRGGTPAETAGVPETADEQVMHYRTKLDEAESALAVEQERSTKLQHEVNQLKAALAQARGGTVASRGPVLPPPTPTGPPPANLPYSLYTGVISTTSGETRTLTGVSFGKIDRIPLIMKEGAVEVNMKLVKHLRRLGKWDETAKQVPVRLTLHDGEEIRGQLPVEEVSGVDPRINTKVQIPITTIIELEFR